MFRDISNSRKMRNFFSEKVNIKTVSGADALSEYLNGNITKG